MPSHRFLAICSALLCLLPQVLLAQKTGHPFAFDQVLAEAGLEVFEPLDAGYRPLEPLENEYLNCQFALYSNREDLELRYYVLPWNEQDKLSTTPNVATFRVLTTVASNADDALISALQLEPETLQKEFNADWGMVYFFTPKPAFSTAPSAKMLAVSKEGKGTAFVFFFFDNPNNSALDTRHWAVRFQGGPTGAQK
jgi:hypothetical protein